MTIAVIQEFDGATLEQYDRVIDKMGITPSGEHPHPGCLFHWVAQTASGLTITPRKIVMTIVMTSTTVVRLRASLRVGQ